MGWGEMEGAGGNTDTGYSLGEKRQIGRGALGKSGGNGGGLDCVGILGGRVGWGEMEGAGGNTDTGYSLGRGGGGGGGG